MSSSQTKLPAIPSEIATYASACAGYVEKLVGIRPDGTSETLSLVDHYVRHGRENLASRPELEALLVSGLSAYFGQVLLGAFAGWWHMPEADPLTWEVRFRRSFVAVRPGVLMVSALGIQPDAGLSAGLRVDEADMEDLETYLNALPQVSEESYWLASTQFDTLEIVHGFIGGRAANRGLSDVDFEDDDYQLT